MSNSFIGGFRVNNRQNYDRELFVLSDISVQNDCELIKENKNLLKMRSDDEKRQD